MQEASVPNGAELTVSVTLGDSQFEASGPAETVMQAFAEFKEMTAAPALKRAAKIEEAPDPPEEDPAAPTTPQKSEASKVPLPQFLNTAKIKDKGNAGTATAVIAWAADHDRKSILTPPEIRDLWRGTNMKVPANVNRDIATAVKQGWVVKEGRGYSVTGYGRTEIGLS